jgi:hypothetical protein
MKQIRLAQALRLVLYGHEEAPHPIARTLTLDDLNEEDVRGVRKFVSQQAETEATFRELGLLDLGGEGG